MITKLTIILLLLSGVSLSGQHIDVWFLYGSEPAKGFESHERKWFGGKKGGHVGIGVCKDSILHFVPAGSVRAFPVKNHYGHFLMSNQAAFLSIFGTDDDSVKFLCIKIPVTEKQEKNVRALTKEYIKSAPYDYAFFGMRCASASADVLEESGVLRKLKLTSIRYFYPARLRKRLLRIARRNNWECISQTGTARRIWEK
jgi:hypothetical protein